MRLISFALTTDQFIDGTKDVTRRLRWKNLKAGTYLMAVRKAMGLKKGEKVERLGPIEVLSVRRERLDAITKRDVIREGFPEMSVLEFIAMFCRHQPDTMPDTEVTRIEFRRLGPYIPSLQAF